MPHRLEEGDAVSFLTLSWLAQKDTSLKHVGRLLVANRYCSVAMLGRVLIHIHCLRQIGRINVVIMFLKMQ